MDDREKLERADEIMRAIGRVLLREWDPIGIRDLPQCQSEYDRYIGGVYRLLVTGARPADMAQHLQSIQVEEMGLSTGQEEKLAAVAKRLCAINVRLAGAGQR
jgi:hypothetical protein